MRKTLVVGLALCVAPPGAAQDRAYARASLAAAQVYEGNLYAQPGADARGDLIARVSPSLEAGYRAQPLAVRAAYAFDAERYLANPDLSKALARQQAGLDVRLNPARRLDVLVEGVYVTTETPAEFNRGSLLAAGRMHGTRAGVSSTAAYGWSAATRLTAASVLSREAVANGVASTTRSARAAIERRAARRTTYRGAYQADLVTFSNGVAQPSHVISGAWVQSVTPLTTVEVEAGPRMAADGVRPELWIRATREIPRATGALTYGHTRATAIGESGLFDVDRLSAAGTYRATRRAVVTAAAELARSGRAGITMAVRTVTVGATFRMSRDLAVTASAAAGAQSGTPGIPDESIPYRKMTVGFDVGVPRFGGGRVREPL